MKIYALMFLFTFRLAIMASQPSFFFVNLHPNPCGMFSVFSYVVGVLYEYEKKPHSGIEVNFEEFGLYYDSAYGPNWWNYYCEPISLGSKENAVIREFNVHEYTHFAFFTERRLSRQQVFEMIQKYIKIREPILNKVDQFVSEHFLGHHIISLHYRGTDKSIEAPRVAFDEVKESVETYIHENQLENYKIFVATDEQKFLDQMELAFPGRVIAYDSIRSLDGKPIHRGRWIKNSYQLGEDALIDSLLLSRGDYLIRTSSNLSLWSTYFNPSIPVLELNKRKGKKVSAESASIR